MNTAVQEISKRYIRIAKFADETGYSVKAVEKKIEDGVWLEGTHYIRAPDRTIHMEMGAYYKWLESQKPSG